MIKAELTSLVIIDVTSGKSFMSIYFDSFGESAQFWSPKVEFP